MKTPYLVKTRGIIFKSVKYSESSLILDVYTEELGLRSYIVKGVRSKSGKNLAGHFQLMQVLDMVVYNNEAKALNYIKEYSLHHVYLNLPFDIKRSSVGVFMIEVARKSIKEREKNQRLFDFIMEGISRLEHDGHDRLLYLHLKFMVELSGYLGFFPQGRHSPETPSFDLKEGTFTNYSGHLYTIDEPFSRSFSQIIETDWTFINTLQIDKIHRNALLDKLLEYYQYHLDIQGSFHSLDILKEVFS